MREILELETEAQAKAVSDYLEVGGVEVTIRGNAPFTIWVLDDDLVDKAEDLLRDFDGSDTHAAKAASIRTQRERDAKPRAPVRAQGSSTSVSTGALTTIMLVVSVGVGFASDLGSNFDSSVLRAFLVVPTFFEYGQLMAPVKLDWSEPWRLLGPMFIHFGLIHLVFNMFWLYQLGNQIEARHSIVVLAVLAIVSEVVSSVVQFQISGPLFGGMSGVNYALFGFVWMQARYGHKGYGIEPRDVVLLMGWLLLCTTGIIGAVANASHAIGLAVGVTAGFPAYLAYRKAHQDLGSFAKGSWEDLNIKGSRRLLRLYVQPYAPYWFLVTAAAVLLLDWATSSSL